MSAQGFSIASAFLNYAPCLVGGFPAGVQITAAGIEFSPTGEPSINLRIQAKPGALSTSRPSESKVRTRPCIPACRGA